ncbi:MAG TPA: GNAT family N-acetyltransferase [Acidimicrobiales bacterium]|nr:GNAT family N-acetyltransferase [Acidimicrobiales bacterium]
MPGFLPQARAGHARCAIVVAVPKARLGVALLLPEPVATEVNGLRRALGDGALARIPPHVTLVPPVNVRHDRLDDAFTRLRAAAAATRPFRLSLGPAATFHPVNPVVYLAVDGDLGDLHALRDRVFVEPLARSLTWPFVPHVTLADDLAVERIAPAAAALADYCLEVAFDRVHLLEEGEGRTWQPVADAVFAAPAVVGRGGLPLELSFSERLDPPAAAFAEDEWRRLHDDVGPGRIPVAVTGRRDGQVVGVAVGWAEPAAAVAYLHDLIVEAGVRNEGIGSHLLAAFESWAAERGCDTLRVRTDTAERFYRERGWVEELRLPEYRRGVEFVQLRRDRGDQE